MPCLRYVVAVALSAGLGNVLAASTTLATLQLGLDASGTAVDPSLGRAFVVNLTSGTLSVVDIGSLAVSATIAVGANPRRVVEDVATSRVYVLNDNSPGQITVVDARSNAIVATVAVGNDPRGLAADFLVGQLYVTNRASGTLSIVNAATNAVAATVAVGANPAGVDVDHDRGKIYVVNGTGNTVTSVDQNTHAVKTIAVGAGPVFPRVDARTGKVYVNNVTDKTVTVIDSATDTVVKTIGVGSGTTSNFVTDSPVYHRAYLPNAVDNTLSIIDTDAIAVVRTVAVGRSPQELVVDRDGGDLYVVNQGDNTVTIMSAGADSVEGVVAAGNAPARAVVDLAQQRLLVQSANGNAPDTLTIASTQDTLAGTAVATEFHHAAFDHYFHSASSVETTLLVDGLFGNDWNVTFEYWRVWTAAAPGRMPVCRFFSASFAPKSSHFFTPYAAECASLQQGSVWQYEGTAYYVSLPDAGGNCAAGTAPLYRLYNNGMGGAPNHRYTPDRAVRDQMKTAGWVAEGSGPDVVFACTPTLTNG